MGLCVRVYFFLKQIKGKGKEKKEFVSLLLIVNAILSYLFKKKKEKVFG